MIRLPLSNLNREEVEDIYGHAYVESDIKSLYPYEHGEFCREDYNSKNFTVTYDPLTAMNLRKRNIPIVVWGKKNKDNTRAFVFRQPRQLVSGF